MEYKEKNGGIIVSGIGAVCLKNIFDNGQCFRFIPEGDAYKGVAKGRYVEFSSVEEGLFIYPATKKEFEDIWADYLDIEKDYSSLFPKPDEYLKMGMEYAPGLRLLKQDPYETLISFIISANNNIKRIRGIIEKMCERYGEKKICGDREFYDFPKAEVLASLCEKDLQDIGAGYRASYIIKTAKSILDGFDIESLRNEDYFTAKKRLCTLMGVGPKVADCILLFSLGHSRAFPCDVWIKRVLSECYGFCGTDKEVSEFAYDRFGENAGIAQQYLFFRQKSINTKQEN